MPSPIAEAFVRISPKLIENFSGLLKADIEAKLAKFTPPPIFVEMKLAVGSRERIRKEIAAITGATIKVTPVISGAPVTGGTAGGGAAGGGASGITEIERARARTRAALAKFEEDAVKKANVQIAKSFKERADEEAAESVTATKAARVDIANFEAQKKAALTAGEAIARAQRSQSRIGTAGALSATPVAKAQAELRAANAFARDAERAQKALSSSIVSTNEALNRQVAALVRSSAAQVEHAEKTLLDTRAERDNAAALRLQNAQVSTGLRGAAATALSFAGLRGATLAASGAFLAGAASATLLVKSVGAFASFESTLNNFQAVTGATADQMERVSEAAQRLGNDITLPAVNAADAATAMAELAKAGLSVNQSIAATRGVLQLATAAAIDNAEAVQLVATALNAFHLAGNQAVPVADAFANAANAAQGSISDFGQAMAQASAVAAQSGLSFQNTIALLTLFARNGLRGSDAGTSLRTALIKLIAPTKDANQVIQTLGLRIRDAQGNIRPDIFAQFGEATRNLSPALRDNFAEIIAGTDAIRAFAIGSREGFAGLADAQTQINKLGTAAEVSAARTRGLAGQSEAFKNTAATLAISVGRGVAPAVERLVSAATQAVNSLGTLTRIFGDLLRPLAPLGEVLGKVAEALGAGTLPVLAGLGAYKALKSAYEAVIATSARLVGSNAALAASQEAVIAVDEAAVAANQQLAAAQGEAAVANATRGLSVGTLATSLRGLLNPVTLLTAGAIGLGFAIRAFANRQSSAEKATDALTKALRRQISATSDLGKAQAATAVQNDLNTLRGVLRQDAADRTATTVRGRIAPRGFVGQITDPNEKARISQENLTKANEKFIKTIREQADAFRDQSPLIGHNLDLLGDLARILGHIPTQKEIGVILKNKDTSTSLAEIQQLFAKLGGQAGQDAEKLGNTLSERISIGIARGPISNPNIVSPLFAAADKANSAFKLGKILPSLDGAARDKTLADFRSLIAQLAALGEPGQVQLRALGRRLGLAFAQGISEEDKAAVAAANQAVQDAITEGNKQVNDAVNSAKQNLGSIAGDLAGKVGQVLDARAEAAIAALDRSKLGKEITALTNELDKSNAADQRGQLRFQIASAVDESSRRSAVEQLRQFDIQTKLEADKKKLQSEKDNITKTANLQKEAITKNLAAYADAYAKGQITLSQFSGKVLATLHKQIPDFNTVGKNLGTAFSSGFQEEITAFIQQAQALAGFFGRTPGGINQTNVVKPAETLAQVSKQIADAQKQRDEKSRALQADQLLELQAINRALKGPPVSFSPLTKGVVAETARNQGKKIKG